MSLQSPEIPCHTPASVFPSLVGRYDHRVHTVLGMEETVAAQPVVIKIENRVVKNLALLILSDGRTPLLVESIFIERGQETGYGVRPVILLPDTSYRL